MSTLVILVHPNLETSRVNKAWKEALEQHDDVTVHDLYATYPDFKIDVAREQQLLLSHDLIVFQFPFYWYSSPALLKEWQDVVLSYGWAYGQSGTQLHGKEFVLAVSTGGPADAYRPDGYNRFTMEELLSPFRAIANLTGMTYLPPYIESGVRTLTAEQLELSARHLVEHVTEVHLIRK
ncbi:NAD(P)H-dependent oxidoreductase [Exiguobacterium sp. s48]|uniref:NAD(P)H-dependent oxidoreductase n=1 Tax=Exiguobacterium sp. s48 TaxID=2751273 RepID=UPI001BECD8D0|nr:NAD(P)H-dependent oxidoreductase [Exiguobacterium sp. s48]